MKNNTRYLPGRLLTHKANKAVKIFAVIIFFVAVFLFVDSIKAQNVRQFVSPHLACQSYYKQQGFSIVRDLEHDCLVRAGNNKTGFVYTHYYDSGSNFCLEITSSMGRVFGPQCISISSTGRAKQQPEQTNNKIPKIVTTPAFQIRELQYDTLPTGKPVESGDNERIEIKMPDGSLIQLDANATFTPVSKYEVHSVFGRYRYLWRPFHDGKCIVGQNLVRQECRKVKTRDAILTDKGTEFLVETDTAGTKVTVLDGIVVATDLNGKKTVEIPAGQTAYIKHGGLPEEPKVFDADKVDRWWEKEDAKQNSQSVFIIIIGLVFFILLILAIVKIIKKIGKKIFGKKKTDIVIAPVAEKNNQKTLGVEKNNNESKKKKSFLSILILIIIIIFFVVLAVF